MLVRPGIHPHRCLALLALLCVTAWHAPRAAEAELLCAWTTPACGAVREDRLPSPAILACAPRGEIRVQATLNDAPAELVALPDTDAPPEWSAFATTLRLRAPAASGVVEVPLLLRAGDRDASARLAICVPWEASLSGGASGYLTAAGVTVGRYWPPSSSGVRKVRDHPDAYCPPRFFWVLDDRFLEYAISPCLTLGDLVVPDEETHQRHVTVAPVRYDLLDAVAALRAELDARAAKGEALRLLSVYRTPVYNRKIGSGRTSRHLYGDAIDFIVDADGDERMDDLTGDGRVDRADGLWLVALVEDLQADGTIPVGGIGVYTFSGGDHPLTFHLDLRGHRARWAYHHAGGRRREFSWTSRRFAAQDEAEKKARLARRKKN